MHITISEALALYIQKVTVQLSTAKTGYYSKYFTWSHTHVYIYHVFLHRIVLKLL